MRLRAQRAREMSGTRYLCERRDATRAFYAIGETAPSHDRRETVVSFSSYLSAVQVCPLQFSSYDKMAAGPPHSLALSCHLSRRCFRARKTDISSRSPARSSLSQSMVGGNISCAAISVCSGTYRGLEFRGSMCLSGPTPPPRPLSTER